jgi:hypothetical protein
VAEIIKELLHPVFGPLRWDVPYSWWVGGIEDSDGSIIELVLDPGDDERYNFLAGAAALFMRLEDAKERILRQAVDSKVFELYETWRNERERNLTVGGLIKELELMFIRIDTSVPITLSYALGDVFGGHAVDVTVNEDLKVVGVSLTG